MVWIIGALQWRFILSPVKWVEPGRLVAAHLIGALAHGLIQLPVSGLVRAYVVARREHVSVIAVLATTVTDRLVDGVRVSGVAGGRARARRASTSHGGPSGGVEGGGMDVARAVRCPRRFAGHRRDLPGAGCRRRRGRGGVDRAPVGSACRRGVHALLPGAEAAGALGGPSASRPVRGGQEGGDPVPGLLDRAGVRAGAPVDGLRVPGRDPRVSAGRGGSTRDPGHLPGRDDGRPGLFTRWPRRSPLRSRSSWRWWPTAPPYSSASSSSGAKGSHRTSSEP